MLRDVTRCCENVGRCETVAEMSWDVAGCRAHVPPAVSSAHEGQPTIVPRHPRLTTPCSRPRRWHRRQMPPPAIWDHLDPS